MSRRLSILARTPRFSAWRAKGVSMPVSAAPTTGAQLQSFLEGVPLGVAFFDREHRFIQINDAIAQLNGLPREAHIGQRVEDLLPVNASVVGPLIDRVFATGEPIANEEVAGETPAQPGVRRYWLTGYFPVRGEDARIDAVGVWCTEISQRRQAEEALRVREAQLRLALSSSRTGLWVSNRSTGAVTWSTETYELLGLVPGQFGGTADAFYAMVHPADREAAQAAVDTALQRREEIRCEFRVQRQDGQSRWMSVRGRASYDSAGAPAEVLGSITDITDQRHAEAQLRESEERYRGTFENAAVGMAHVSPDGQWLSVNQRLCDILGYTRDELLATTFQAISHPDDLAKDVDLAREVADGRRDHYSIEKRYLRPGGGELWANLTVSARRNADGSFRHFISVVEDIGARKRSEQALQAALLASQTGVFRWDFQDDTLAWDDDLDRLFGLRPGESVRHLTSFLARVHPDDRAGVVERCGRCRSDGADFEMEFRVIWPDGTQRWLYDRGRTFLDAEGRPSYMTGACVDITDRKQVEEALRQADRRKDEFLATLAHELRNPLAPLSTAADLVRRSESREQQLRAVDVMSRQLGHMVRLVDDLMDVSRISRGRLELRLAQMDLRDAATHAAESVRSSVDRRHQRLEVSLPAAPVTIFGDLVRLSQVVGNLLNNASKYTPEHGNIELALRIDNGLALLSVRDDGAGIPQEMLSRVFDLFVQLEPTLERSHGGLGIGLALVRRLVSMHGGTVTAASPGEGLGSVFTVALPLAGGTYIEPSSIAR
jgi:PAS domain S-box-containing protein